MTFYGRNVATEILNSNFKVRNLFLQENINQDSKISTILDLAKQKNIPVNYVSRSQISNISKSDDHQGLCIDVEFTYKKLSDNDLNENDKCFIYISEATYEHNIGAIIRSAEVAGLAGVIIPKNITITSTIAKTSAGGVFHIPIFQEAIYNCLKKFKKNGYKIFGIERGGNYYYDNDLTGNTLFIIGGEDKSLSDGIRKECDDVLEIPQFGKVNSLNMSVATSIVLFERVRQDKIRN